LRWPYVQNVSDREEIIVLTCFANILGDCSGPIEDEHFIPQALQRLIGQAVVSGFAWQKGTSKSLQPSSYAHGRVICQRHHDQLDGLDGNATAYFRNLMLIANPNHVSSGKPGRAEDISSLIDGRALERWFLKLICGSIATGSIKDVNAVPEHLVRALFQRIEWPSEYAIYVVLNTTRVTEADAGFQLAFHWNSNRELNGLIVRSFAIETIFALEIPDRLNGNVLKRPNGLGADIERPSGEQVLQGIPAGEHIRFRFSWPESTGSY
jgi:hypothetical protein